MNKPEALATLAIIGGSGLYEFDEIESPLRVTIDTPFGSPSSPIVVGEIGGMSVAFLARHGSGHGYLPSEINYRANVWALKSLGVKWCLGVSAVGSLTEEFSPLDAVIPSQLIDKTSGREKTFFGDGVIAHASLADPYCGTLNRVLAEAAQEVGIRKIHENAVYVCINGPQLSSRAESLMHKSWGANIVGMTNATECALFREAEISYSSLCLVTDYDCWRNQNEEVDAIDIVRNLQSNVSFARSVIPILSRKLKGVEQPASISRCLDKGLITPLEYISEQQREKLGPLFSRLLVQNS